MQCHKLKFDRIDEVENYMPKEIGLRNRIWCSGIESGYVVESWGYEGFCVRFGGECWSLAEGWWRSLL